MPAVGKESQCGQGIVETGGVGKYGSPAQKTVAHKKGVNRLSYCQMMKQWIEKEYIHGNTAQLKGKIPPVVLSAAENESECELFPDLAAEHKDSADDEKKVCFFMPHISFLPPDAAGLHDHGIIIAQSCVYLYQNRI